MIEKQYTCDLCREVIKPEDGYRLFFESFPRNRFKLKSMFSSEASEQIICKSCIKTIKSIEEPPHAN